MFKNFINYTFFQFINYLIPLITIPYIVRIIGAKKFGIISIALAVIYYIRIASQYGFNISGVQYIAQSKNRDEDSKIVTSIFMIQTVLTMISLLILVIIVEIYKDFSSYKEVFYYTFLMIPGNILMAHWFYLGKEQVKYISFITLISKLLYLTSIFIFIKNMSDFVLVPLLNSLSFILGGMLSLLILIGKFKIQLKFQHPILLFQYIKRSWHLFISNLFMNLYRNTNILILSFFSNEYAVGIYSMGEKIIIALQGFMAPITQVFYPYISRIKMSSPSRSISALKKLLFLISLLSILLSIIVFLFANEIAILAFGKDNVSVNLVLRITTFVIFIGAVNYIVGIIFMTNFAMKKEFSKSIIITGIFNIIICSILSYYFSYIGASVAFLTSELILLVIMFIFIINSKNKWKLNNA